MSYLLYDEHGDICYCCLEFSTIMVFSLVNISVTVIGQTKSIHQQNNVYSECCILMNG